MYSEVNTFEKIIKILAIDLRYYFTSQIQTERYEIN